MTTSYANILEKGSRLRKLLIAGATAFVLGAALVTPSWAAVKDPRNLEVDYSRDFVLLEGYPAGANVQVEVFRGADSTAGSGVRIGNHTGEVQPADPTRPNSTTTLEVNHGGAAVGDCWVGSTPDIQPGDKVVTTLVNDTTDTDYTFVRDLAFTENADGTLTGRALGNEVGGNFQMTPLDLTDPDGEAATGDFLEGKRVTEVDNRIFIFAPPAEGGYDATTGDFTSAVLPGGAGDGEVTLQYVKAGGGDAAESTVAGPSNTPPEDLAPAAGCPDKAENAMTSVSPEVVTAASATGNVTVGGVIQDDVNVSLTLNNTALDVTLNRDANTFSATFAASRLNEGNNTLTANFTSPGPVAPQSLIITKDTTAPTFNQGLVRNSGTYNGAFDISLDTPDDANDTIFYTRDGTNPATSNSRLRYQGGPIRINTGRTTFRAVAFDAVNNKSAELSRTYTVRAATSTSLAMNTKAIKLNTRKAISGAVSPANSGNTVKLTIARPGADLVRTLPLVNGRYSFSYKATVLGTHRVSVSFVQDADSQGSTSTVKTFRVIR